MKKTIFLLALITCAIMVQAMAAQETDIELGVNGLRGSVEIKAMDSDTVNSELRIAANCYDMHGVLSAIERAADVNCTDEYGNTPLMLACKYPHNEELLEARTNIVDILLDEGADVQMENAQGASSLSIAQSNSRSQNDAVLHLIMLALSVNRPSLFSYCTML